MVAPTINEDVFAETNDHLVTAALEAMEGLTLPQVHKVQVYGKLMAKQAVEKAAMVQYRANRHTLALQVLESAGEDLS